MEEDGKMFRIADEPPGARGLDFRGHALPRMVFLVAASLIAGNQGAHGFEQSDLVRLIDSNACQRCDFSGGELLGVDMSGADLSEADLQDANLFSASMFRANLLRANLRGANLRRTDLRGAYMRAGRRAVDRHVDGRGWQNVSDS